MRKIRYAVAMSLDGHIAGPKGEYDRIGTDAEVDFAAFWSQFDTLLMGRRTFGLAVRTRGEAAFTVFTGVTSIVFSRTLKQQEHPHATLVPELNADRVRDLKAQNGKDLIPREMAAYATLKKAAANANHAGSRLNDERHRLIVQTCDEILAGQHGDMFPLHVWMTGSGTQFNMNVNEVISNRCCQLAGTPLGSKTPVHPNDHVNMSQSSNDSFPTAMNIAAAVNVKERLIPAVKALRDAVVAKADDWKDIVKIGRTHMQDATPITLGEEWSGYSGMLSDNLERI
jgi:hypothetical protein